MLQVLLPRVKRLGSPHPDVEAQVRLDSGRDTLDTPSVIVSPLEHQFSTRASRHRHASSVYVCGPDIRKLMRVFGPGFESTLNQVGPIPIRQMILL